MKKNKFIKIGLSLMTIIPALTPMSAFAQTSTPVNANIAATPMDVTVSDSVSITGTNGQTDVLISDLVISNNNNLGVATLKQVAITPKDSWKLSPLTDDFTKKAIDSKEVAINYQGHDMTTSYATPQTVNPNEKLTLNFNAKMTISSTALTGVNVADAILTLEYVETVYLDTLKVEYTEQTDSVTVVKPEFIKVTAIYTDGTQRLLSSSEYTVNTLTGTGEENIVVSYSEKGISKEAVVMVNNPYTVTLISDGSANETIKYKFGTGTTLPTPTKTGYTFGGWYENALFEGTPVTKLDATVKGNKTLYAKWIEVKSELTTVTDMKAKLRSFYTDAKQISFVKSPTTTDSSDEESFTFIEYIDISKNQDKSIIASIFELGPYSEARAGVPSSFGYKITIKSKGTIQAPIDCSSMFYDCDNLTSLDLSNFNTSNVTDMSYMFYYCNNLTSLDLSNFNTSKVTDMRYMFFGCRNLTSLDLSNFNTSNVTNMSYMFYYCDNLTSLDNNLIPSWYDSSKWEVD